MGVRCEGELTVDDTVILDRIAILKPARHVNDMHDERRALNVAQELYFVTNAEDQTAVLEEPYILLGNPTD